ncbi:MAG: 16S rRNA (cytosine(1402)-N(4))-methyltransferase RsmH [Coriobacteriales bacterium]
MTQEYRHIPVMLEECMEALQLHDGSVYLDCTLGGAGHSLEAAKRIAPHGILIGIDQDDMALETAGKRLQSCGLDTPPLLLKGNFGDMDRLLVEAEVPGVDAILFDLGVSSPQFDFPERGFSYREDAPLDMRMDPGNNTLTAAEIVNTYNEADLARVLRDYSDEKWASRIAKFIVAQRDEEPILTTFQLVEVIKRAIPAKARREGGHPAKRGFQALRVEVNREMEVLSRALEAALRWLNPGGRIAVMSYQSLEDKMVKEAFRKAANPCTCPPELPVCVCGKEPVLRVITRKPVKAGKAEVEENPRAHSAVLRVAQKL